MTYSLVEYSLCPKTHISRIIRLATPCISLVNLFRYTNVNTTFNKSSQFLFYSARRGEPTPEFHWCWLSNSHVYYKRGQEFKETIVKFKKVDSSKCEMFTYFEMERMWNIGTLTINPTTLGWCTPMWNHHRCWFVCSDDVDNESPN
jgi:hypothetical protein